MNKKILTAIFAILAAIFLTPWIHGNDGAGYYSYVRSAFIDKDINLENEKAHFSQQFSVNSILKDNTTSVYYSQYPIGTPLLWAPFFAAAHITAKLAGLPADGYSSAYIFMINFGSALLAFIGILLTYSSCSKFFQKRTAFISALSFWLASNLFYYMFLEASLSHACSFFAVSLMAYCFINVYEKGTFKQWAALGLASALVIMVRYQDGLYLSIPLIFSIAKYISFRRSFRKIKILLAKNITYLACLILGVIPQLLTLKYQHGAYFSALQNYQTAISFSITHIGSVLFSANHGLFLWTPIALLGFAGLIKQASGREKDKKNISLLFITAFLAQLVFVASTAEWHGAQSFSHRMFVSSGTLLIFGLCSAVDFIEKKTNRKVCIALMTVLCVWNFGLMAQYGLRMIPAEGAVNFSQVFYNTFFRIPSKIKEIAGALWQ